MAPLSDTFMKRPVKCDGLGAQSQAPFCPMPRMLDWPQPVAFPNGVSICWAQWSAAQIVLLGSCLEILELELAQPISHTDIFYSYFLSKGVTRRNSFYLGVIQMAALNLCSLVLFNLGGTIVLLHANSNRVF